MVEEGRKSFKSSRMYQENEVSRGPVISCILRESSKVEDEMMYVNSPLYKEVQSLVDFLSLNHLVGGGNPLGCQFSVWPIVRKGSITGPGLNKIPHPHALYDPGDPGIVKVLGQRCR